MKTEPKQSKELSENAAQTISDCALYLAILLFFSTIIGCVKDYNKLNTQDRAIAAQLQAVRYQMGIVEGNEHLAR